MNWFKEYAECYKCKDQNGPWILYKQKFYCEKCYEEKKKEEQFNLEEQMRGVKS